MARPPTQQDSPSTLQRLAKIKYLRNVQLALELFNSQPAIPEQQPEMPTIQASQAELDDDSLMDEDDGGGGGGGGSNTAQGDPKNARQQAPTTGYDPIRNRYLMNSARLGGSISTSSATSAQSERSRISPLALDKESQSKAPESIENARNNSESTPDSTSSQSAEETPDSSVSSGLPSQDPAYTQRAALKEKAEEAKKLLESAGTDAGIAAISKVTDKYWNGLWGTIPPLITGVGIIAFIGATVAVWASLGRTVFDGLTNRMFGKAARLLPPKMGPTLNGISMAGFFVASHTIWLLFFIALAGVIAMTVLPYLIPFFAAGLIITSVTGG
jgi:hypothetical protein